jgi:hypothetical protein
MDLETFLGEVGDLTTEELTHFGVKGMHWGVRRSPEERSARTARKITKVAGHIASHEEAIKNIKSHIEDANKNGLDSELFRKRYGTFYTDASYKAIHGKGRDQLLAEHKQNLQNELNDRIAARRINNDRLERLQRKQARR